MTINIQLQARTRWVVAVLSLVLFVCHPSWKLFVNCAPPDELAKAHQLNIFVPGAKLSENEGPCKRVDTSPAAPPPNATLAGVCSQQALRGQRVGAPGRGGNLGNSKNVNHTADPAAAGLSAGRALNEVNLAQRTFRRSVGQQQQQQQPPYGTGSLVSPPKLVQWSKEAVQYYEGSTLVLSCSLSYSGGERAPLRFSWFKQGKLLANSGSSSSSNREQQQRLSIETLTDYSFLRLADLRPTDSGAYTCVVSNSLNQEDRTTTQVVVNVKLKWLMPINGPADGNKTSIIGNGHQFDKVRAGQSVSFECNAAGGGHPRAPRVRWFRLGNNNMAGSKDHYHKTTNPHRPIDAAQLKASLLQMDTNQALGGDAYERIELINSSGENEIHKDKQQVSAMTNDSSNGGQQLRWRIEMNSGQSTSNGQQHEIYSRLILDRLDPGASGLFECEVFTLPDQQYINKHLDVGPVAHGERLSASDRLRRYFGLFVNAPATFEQKFQVHQAKLGDSVRLECNARGDQPLRVDWFYDGNKTAIERIGNEFYEIYEQATDWGLASYMQVRSLRLHDSQLYKCVASNEFGSNDKLIKLIVLNVPERPTNLRAHDIWSRSVLVSWNHATGQQLVGAKQPNEAATLSNPIISLPATSGRVSNFTVQFWRKTASTHPNVAPTAQNHRRESITVDGLQSSALLAGLQPALTYEVSVIAQNQVGQSEPSETIQVSTSEEEPSAPPTDVQVESLGGATIRVMWKAPPVEGLNGRLMGFYVGYRTKPSAMLLSGQLGVNQLTQQQSNSLNSIQHSQQQQQQLPIYSFKTVDAVERQLYYETFLANLKHLTEYEVTVRTFNKAGSGPDSQVLAARTGSPRLPGPPALQVQRVTSDSVALKWMGPTSARAQSPAHMNGGSQQAFGLVVPHHFELFYQIQGERDWYQLSVGQQQQQMSVSGPKLVAMALQRQMVGPIQLQQESDLMQVNQQMRGFPQSSGGLAQGPTLTGSTSSLEQMATQEHMAAVNVHTLSNLQPGLTYRIYVVAMNELGLGDPSNVIAVRTHSSGANGQLQDSIQLDGSANYAAGHLASAAGGPASLGSDLLEAITQPQSGLFYTSISFIALVAMLVSLVGYFVWHHRLRCKYNSSSDSSSYPSSWTPAAGDTIQSEYSVKRLPVLQHHQKQHLLPSSAVAAASLGTATTSTTIKHHGSRYQQQELYDEVECVAQQQQQGPTSRQQAAFQQQQMHQFATASRMASKQHQQHQHQQPMRSSTTARPLLTSHYHQPASLLIGNSPATLQLNKANGPKTGRNSSQQQHQHQHQHHFSSTLNRHQNRQLPPIPYSTMSVANSKDQPTTTMAPSAIQRGAQKAITTTSYGTSSVGQCGSQTPLIYGVID